jgi:hypothetical protein
MGELHYSVFTTAMVNWYLPQPMPPLAGMVHSKGKVQNMGTFVWMAEAVDSEGKCYTGKRNNYFDTLTR